MSQWYVISGGDLRAALDRAASGDDPGVVIAEIYANSAAAGDPSETDRSADIKQIISNALDPILAEYVGPPIPHMAIGIVLEMAEKAVLTALAETEVLPGAPDGE